MELDHTITLAIEQFVAWLKAAKGPATVSYPINSRDADEKKVAAAVAEAAKAIGRPIDHKLVLHRLILSTGTTA